MLIGPRAKLKIHKAYAFIYTIKLKLNMKRKYKSLYMGKNVHIVGTNAIDLGSNVVISENTWINVNHRDKKERQFVVGNNVLIGKNNFFSVGKRIELGDYFFSSKDCKFLGASHVPEPMAPYSSNKVTEKNCITIGTNVFVGAGSAIIGDVTIGYGVIIGGDSVITKDIPPLSIAVGNPARIIKRYDLKNKTWFPATKMVDLEYPSESEYVRDYLKEDNRQLYNYIYAAESRYWL